MLKDFLLLHNYRNDLIIPDSNSFCIRIAPVCGKYFSVIKNLLLRVTYSILLRKETLASRQQKETRNIVRNKTCNEFYCELIVCYCNIIL